ncbi:ABC transporter permease [Actinomadura scrupuli]|uniref:ABC transporter permease n=1 Tax=Actinomadura scrupuli TaxID=559629 RepID=UPI003D98B7AA
MIWLTWRQFRTQAAVVYGAIAVFAVALAATGPRLAHQYRTRGNDFLREISGTCTGLYVAGVLAVLALPFIIGLFWGAPLVTRELDAGTHRLAWTQTTRTRWLVTKLGLTGLAAMAAAGLLSLAVTWWAGPIDEAIGNVTGMPGPGLLIFPRLSPEIFDARGLVPVGHAALAFVLGVTIGVIVRRTLPAMAIVLAVFAVVQVTMSVGVRPHLVAPEHLTTTVTNANLMNLNMFNNLTVTIDKPGAWVISQHTVNAAGHPAPVPSWMLSCPPGSGSGPASRECLARFTRLGYRQQVTYQPAGRFWALQLYETVIYLVLAGLLGGLCTWWIRHRLS